MKALAISLSAAATLCVLATSCVTTPGTPQYVEILCSVHSPAPEPGTSTRTQYDFRVDGALVASGIVGKGTYSHNVPLLPGEHTIEVVSEACETWERTVTVLPGAKKQAFYILLEKAQGD